MDYKKEYLKLRKELEEAQNLNIILNDALIDFEENFDLHIEKALKTTLDNYSEIFNPAPIETKAVYNNKSELYRFQLPQVICFSTMGAGRTKHIFLRNKVKSSIGDNRLTDNVLVNASTEKLISKLDPIGVTLAQVSKDFVVNLGYYDVEAGNVICKLKGVKEEIASFPLMPKWSKDFITKKTEFNSIFSLHKKLLSYIPPK